MILVAGPQPPSHHDGSAKNLSGYGGPDDRGGRVLVTLVVLSSRICVLILRFLLGVSCLLWVCLLLWVNFGCVGYRLHSNMIGTTMEFGHKFHGTLHLSKGEKELLVCSI